MLVLIDKLQFEDIDPFNFWEPIDMDIEGTRGYIKNTNIDDMSVTKTFSMVEALTPFGAVNDDPFRSAMTYVQTAKHAMRTIKSSPLLITNGADEALPYLNSATYAVKAQANGKVFQLDKDKMIIEYDREIPNDIDGVTGTSSKYRVVSLKETVKKNSDGGFYVTVKLDTDLKLGQKFKEGQIIAYDTFWRRQELFICRTQKDLMIAAEGFGKTVFLGGLQKGVFGM